MFSALISALANAAQSLIDKILTKNRNITGLSLIKFEMPIIAALMIVPATIFGKISGDFFSVGYILTFSGIIIAGFISNSLFYTALKKKDLCEVEPITLLYTPIAISMAMLLFSSERSIDIFIISIIATITLIASRFNKKHLDFDKYSWQLLFVDLVWATESVLVKHILQVVNPVSLYCLRTAFLAAAFLIFYKKYRIKRAKPKEYAQILASSLITSIGWVTNFIAISMIGVVKTSLIFLLSPIIIILASKLFLKEKIPRKRAFGDAVIILCIAVMLVR